MSSQEQLRAISLIIVLAALGGISSVLVGYAGRLLGTIPVFSFVGGQLISGLHVLWLVLAAVMVRKPGAAIVTGAIKGLIEVSLFSHLGIFSFVVALLEGVIVDLVFIFFKKKSATSILLAGGFASASNLIVVHWFFLPSLTFLVYFAAYLASFLSGVIFGGYLAIQILRIIPTNLTSLRED